MSGQHGGGHKKGYKGPWFEDKGQSVPGHHGEETHGGSKGGTKQQPPAQAPHSVKVPQQAPKP